LSRRGAVVNGDGRLCLSDRARPGAAAGGTL